ncbi:MAG: hypothetical protein ACRDNW_23280, partial [Trebonia sp.]
MANDNETDPLDRWLSQQAPPLPPPPGTFELITKRARRRRVRKALISVTSAAVVAAAVGIAVPLSMTLHLSPKPTDANLAAGSATPSTHGSQSAPGAASTQPAKPTPSKPTASGSASQGQATGGYLPPNFRPTSVTWDSTSTGWVLGPAGTPGKCANANPDVCTSVARTGDGGQTWHGLPAPNTIGVTGLRFLNATYGWAFGPELWATDNGGAEWHRVNTGGLTVTDLETLDGRAYALFATCGTPPGGTGTSIADCTSYTLKTATAGSGDWTPVSGVPAGLTGGASPSAAVIELAVATQATQATDYLIAPDGTLYAGPADGGPWHSVSTVPCPPSLVPGGVLANGQPLDVMLTQLGTASPGVARLGLACSLPEDPQGYATVAYISNDGGATWTKQSGVGTSGTAFLGQAKSLTSIGTDGTLILATSTGIYRLPLGATQWQRATVSDPPGHAGFTFVGMTSPAQGVALAPGQTKIW